MDYELMKSRWETERYRKKLKELEDELANMSESNESSEDAPESPCPRLARSPADPEAFIERHRQRSREYYKRKKASIVAAPKQQCEFVNSFNSTKCPNMVKCKFASDGVTALKVYCSQHRYREKADAKAALKEIMTDLD